MIRPDTNVKRPVESAGDRLYAAVVGRSMGDVVTGGGRLLRQVGWVGYGVAASVYGLVAALEAALPGAEHVGVRLAVLAALFAGGAFLAVTIVQRLACTYCVALDEARMAGVRLAVRTAQHELNNCLTLTVSNAELLVEHPDLAPALVPLAEQTRSGALAAADTVHRLAMVDRLRELDWGPRLEPTLDLRR